MGRAIVRDPNVFLFDELLSDLDAKLRVQMRSELKELYQRLSTTTIYVTHDQIEAMTLCDKIVVMNNGPVEPFGPPLELYDSPQTLFVVAFIGSPQTNFFEEVLTDRMSVILHGEVEFNLQKQVAQARMEVTIGIRPERFSLGKSGLSAEVSVVEPTGSETQITTRFAGGTARILLRGRSKARPGYTVHLSASPEDIHVFSNATKMALS